MKFYKHRTVECLCKIHVSTLCKKWKNTYIQQLRATDNNKCCVTII